MSSQSEPSAPHDEPAAPDEPVPAATSAGSPVVTVFRSRLDPAAAGAYGPVAARMSELAASMPGFLDAKTFAAADGERVTIVTFADRASHDGWRDHPEHRDAQRQGIESFYATYAIQVATVTYDHRFSRGAGS